MYGYADMTDITVSHRKVLIIRTKYERFLLFYWSLNKEFLTFVPKSHESHINENFSFNAWAYLKKYLSKCL
jgi:hypothetical protein